MKTHTTLRIAALVSAALASSMLTGLTAPLYEENFDNTTGGNQSVNYITGWQSYRGATGTNISSSATADAAGYSAIASAAGNPNTPNGYLFANRGTDSGNQIFSIVDTFGTGLSLADNAEISFTMGNTTSSAAVRLLIQLGGNGTAGTGNWYASTALFQDAGGFSGTSFAAASTESVTYSLNFSTDAADWRAYTLNPGTAMSIGSTLGSDLSSSTITGLGFYVTPGFSQQTVRLDHLTVVPEPGTIGLLVASLSVAMIARRRMQKHS